MEKKNTMTVEGSWEEAQGNFLDDNNILDLLEIWIINRYAFSSAMNYILLL